MLLSTKATVPLRRLAIPSEKRLRTERERFSDVVIRFSDVVIRYSLTIPQRWGTKKMYMYDNIGSTGKPFDSRHQ